MPASGRALLQLRGVGSQHLDVFRRRRRSISARCFMFSAWRPETLAVTAPAGQSVLHNIMPLLLRATAWFWRQSEYRAGAARSYSGGIRGIWCAAVRLWPTAPNPTASRPQRIYLMVQFLRRHHWCTYVSAHRNSTLPKFILSFCRWMVFSSGLLNLSKAEPIERAGRPIARRPPGSDRLAPAVALRCRPDRHQHPVHDLVLRSRFLRYGGAFDLLTDSVFRASAWVVHPLDPFSLHHILCRNP